MTSLPTIEEQAEYYDKWNEECRDGGYEDVDQEIKARANEILRAIEAHKVPAREILEIGCGTGWFTEKLSRLGNVTAVDLSPRAIEIARGRGTGAQLLACNILDHDFGAQRFDLIVCVETLFYVEDVDRLIEKMADLCTDQGYLAVTIINKFVYERSGDIGPPEKGQIRNWLSRRETLERIERFFDVMSVTTVEPRGNMGILRLVNSHKVNRVLGRFVASSAIKKAKERLGLGGGIVIVARKGTRKP